MVSDPLLQPTVRKPRDGRAPWRLGSQGYVAFFGGITAATAIALMNASRLELPAARRWAIAATGLVAAVTAVTFVLLVEDARVRFASRLCAMVAYLVQARLQGPADRAFRFRSGEYSSLWGAGAAVVFGYGILEMIILTGVAR